MATIEIKELWKKYNGVTVLENISMLLTSGKIYGLAGRNGSGKTLLLKHICGFVKPTMGFVVINEKVIGKDMDRPESCGVIIETPGFIPDYTGEKNLLLLAMIKGMIGKTEIDNTMRLVGLDPYDKKHVGKYSLGMRQRLGIAQALMENPDILLLDEPLNGLDNEGVEEMREVILQQKEKGKLIVIASHNREDLGRLCDVVFHFDNGRIVDTI